MLNPSLSAAGGMGDINIVYPGVPAIPSAATISPARLVTRVTGAVAVANITPPSPYFNGPIYLLSTDAAPFTTVATGNIALATTVIRYRLLTLVFDPAVGKWYPSY
jgi:hypothetical protein